MGYTQAVFNWWYAMTSSNARTKWTVMLSTLLLAGTVYGQESRGAAERSTMDTISFKAMGQEALAETVIEGGLVPIDDNRPEPGTGPLADNYSPFADPMMMPLDDARAGFNRFSLNVEINYQNPKSIPGIEFGNSYNMAPLPSNRTYDFYEFSTTER